MGAVALAGFIKGWSKAESERIDKEREDQETLMLNRLKTAALNKKQIEEEGVKLKQAAKSRYDFVETNFADATEQQKIAIASNPFIVEQLTAKINAREVITKEDLDKFLVTNLDKIKWKTAKEYYESQAQPFMATPIQALETQTGRLGERISPKRSKLESMSATFGAKSPEELLAYEGAKRPEAPEVLGSMRSGFLSKPKSFDQQIDQQLQMVYSLEQSNPDSPEFKEAKSKLDSMITWKETLNPAQATIASRINDLGLKANEFAKAGDTDNESRLLKEIRRLQSYQSTEKGKEGKSFDDMTYSQISSSLTKGVVNQLGEFFGPDVKDQLIIETSLDGSSTFKYTGTNEQLRKAIYQKRNEIVKQIAQPWLVKNKPTTAAARQAILSTGVQLKDDGTLSDEVVFFRGVDQPEPEASDAFKGKIAGAPVAPAAVTGANQKTVTKAQVEMVAKNKGVSYKEAADKARQDGYTILGE